MSQHLEEKIRARAYEIWEKEGRPEGREREHWETAARELGAETEMPRHENFVSGVEDDPPAPGVGTTPTGEPEAPASAVDAVPSAASMPGGDTASPAGTAAKPRTRRTAGAKG
jgi:hypothetical protein